jgi:putative peptide zinc metalloprotease protein
VSYPELASVMGGPLAVHRDSHGRLVPEHAVYRVLCRVKGKNISGYFIAGQVSLEATPRSISSLIWNNFLGLLVRETNW